MSVDRDPEASGQIPKLGVVFTGQGFDRNQIKDFDERLERYTIVRSQYEAVFERPCPSAHTCDFALNENSVLALLLSAFDAHDANRGLRDEVAIATGYSVGFYIAMWYAGILDDISAARLLFRRCKVMNEAAVLSPSAMIAVLGVPVGKLEQMMAGFPVDRNEVLAVSNENAPGNVTVAGNFDCVNRFADFAITRGAYKVVHLNTAGAWHTTLMSPAIDGLKSAVSEELFRDGDVQLIENVHGAPFPLDREERMDLLVAHLCKRVRWSDCVKTMVRLGVTEFIELTDFDMLTKLGPGISRRTEFRSAGVT